MIEQITRLNAGVECEVRPIRTSGDKDAQSALADIGGEGLFVKELQKALAERTIDLAVHSLKDLPTASPPGLRIGAVCLREDVRDVLISSFGKPLRDLPPGARLGTGSRRRAAQFLHYRPDLTMVSVRGNVDTRIRKAAQPDLDGVVMAAAGVKRLGLERHITEYIPLDICLPAPGQGAIAVEVRTDDEVTLRAVALANHEPTFRAIAAERAFLARLGGGCQAPLGAYAREDEGRLEIEGMVASPDGSRLLRSHRSGPTDHPSEIGIALAEILLEMGAEEILAQSSAR